ncbi:MAG: aldehyde dehydrogenase family protein [Candidatus Thermoplasmatota archaeon]|nr:aldehyde dehydrogenase family protein [Candidatus Thermoplasmatota archaeon]MCL5963334.1 aldehyde dehydrogenase family protein [Candidatus Thermoplasmatota archaeon]
MAIIRVINPYTGNVVGKYEEDSRNSIIKKISIVKKNQLTLKKDIKERIELLKKIKYNFEKNIDELSNLVTNEMGKPITQSYNEIKKSINLIDYTIEHAEQFLSPELISTEAKRSYVRYDPLGVILIIMPWNFPVWQVMRAAIPAIAAGNGIILKHASIVSGTSSMLERLFETEVFKSVILKGAAINNFIKYFDGLSFTGSTSAGTIIYQEAAKNLKKVVMELGGSDPFIVIDDSNFEITVKNAVLGRLQNNGQSCIASKRFIVHESVYEEFYTAIREQFMKVKMGDPASKDTVLGPLSGNEQTKILKKQLRYLVSIGKVERFGEDNGNIVTPTIVRTDHLYNEELFGPVAILKKYRKAEEAIDMANETPYGLGASIWGNRDNAEKIVPWIDAGMVFINKIVTSDPRLPFGGIKKSGIGRELSKYGMVEFTNVKSVWVS